MAERAPPFFKRIGTIVTGTTAAVTPAWPTHSTGDIGILIAEANWGGAGTQNSLALTDAQGFTEIGLVQNVGGGGQFAGTQLAAYWCRATSSSMSAPSVQANNDHISAVIFTIGAAKAEGDPIAAGGTPGTDASNTTAATSHTLIGMTTLLDKCIVFTCMSGQADSATLGASGWTNTNMEGVLEILDNSITTANGGGMAAAYGIMLTAGATSTTAVNTSTSEVASHLTFALAPDIPIEGMSFPTLDALTSSATATTTISGSASITLGALTVNGAAPAVNDSVAPTIENFTPAIGETIRPATVLQFDILDETSLALVAVVASLNIDGEEVVEVVHDGDEFRGNYLNSANTRTTISGGYRLTVKRDGGWPSAPTLEYLVLDAGGNIAEIP